jgi:hypothetical protein
MPLRALIYATEYDRSNEMLMSHVDKESKFKGRQPPGFNPFSNKYPLLHDARIQ